MNQHSQQTKKTARPKALVILLPILAVSLFFSSDHIANLYQAVMWRMFGPGLTLGSASRLSEPITIPIIPPQEFDGLSLYEIYAKRIAEVVKFPELFNGTYYPSNEVFGGIEDGKNWWGLEGIFFYGPSLDADKGHSEESRFILNPFALVGIVETSAYPSAVTPVSETYYPIANSLTLDPKRRLATISYDMTGSVKHLNHLYYKAPRDEWIWGLDTLNARDFGFSTLTIQSATGIVREKETQQERLRHFIHLGGSCGMTGGCNNSSPRVAGLIFKVTEFPATIVLGLWEGEPPSSKDSAPDLSYSISLTCSARICEK